MSRVPLEPHVPVFLTCAVYPEIPIITSLPDAEAMVSIRFGAFVAPVISLDFFDVEVLRLLRGAVDEAERILAGRIAYVDSLPERIV